MGAVKDWRCINCKRVIKSAREPLQCHCGEFRSFVECDAALAKARPNPIGQAALR
jgi:hypothetical protein